MKSQHLQQELEDTTSKPLSDTNDEEEKPRNQSIAQIVYADNRVRIQISIFIFYNTVSKNVFSTLYQTVDILVVFQKKARSSHLMLEKFNPRRMIGMSHEGNELPMYNQPSDTRLYHDNKMK